MTPLFTRSQKGFCCSRATGTRFLYLAAALFWMTVSTSLPPFLHAQELDETRQRRATIRSQIVWDNVGDTRQYVRGEQPKRSLPSRVHSVCLDPNEFVEFLVPAHGLVRVVSDDGRRVNDQVEIWTSNGSGLYRKQNAAFTPDGRSIVAAPNQGALSVARVYRPACLRGAANVQVYTSRRTKPKLLDYYQCPIDRCGPQVQIRDDRGQTPRDYATMPGGTKRRLVVEGPKRLRIEARLNYGLDIQNRDSFWIRVYVDGVLHRILPFHTKRVLSLRTFVDGCEQVIGQREFAYLDLDCGKSRVEIQSSHDVYLRVDGVGLNLCRPNLNRSFSFPSWENTQKPISPWDAPNFNWTSQWDSDAISQHFLSEEERGNHSLAVQNSSDWDPYLNFHRIQKLSRDNEVPYSGLRAYMWMRAIASRHEVDPEYGDELDIGALANRLRVRTTFRDLRPLVLQPDSEPRKVAFASRRPRGPKEQQTETVLGQQHLPTAVASIPTASVYRLPMQSNASLQYEFPAQLGSSLLRVIVDQTHLQEQSVLMVQFDNRDPIELTVSPQDTLAQNQFVPGSTDVAMAGLAATHQSFDSGTLGGPFALWNKPAPMVRAATAEFIKPADAKRVRVWLASCKHPSVHIGVQFLDTRMSRLSESAYRFMNNLVISQPNSPMERFGNHELLNDAVELQRWLKTMHTSFAHTVAPSAELQPSSEIWENAELARLHKQATELALKRQWPQAIDLWSKLIQHSEGSIRRDLILSRANVLHSAGEEYLAIREWRGWLRYSDDASLRQACFNRLAELATGNEAALDQLHGFAAVQFHDTFYESKLAQHLLQHGRHRFALQVLSSHVPSEEKTQLLLRCSFQLQWWKLFDQTVAQVRDTSHRNAWKGLKELRMGRYQHAERLLLAGGEAGHRWMEHWQQGKRIFQSMTSRDVSTRMGAIRLWEQWQAGHPGEHHWVDEPIAAKSSGGTAMMYLQQRDVRIPTQFIDAGTTAVVALHGPVRARIEIRPIHTKLDEPIDDWLYLSSGDQVHRVPIIANLSSQSLTIQGSSKRPGERLYVEIDLPAGYNQFNVSLAKSQCLMKIATKRPEIQLPVLPNLNATTIAAVVKGSFGNLRHSCGTDIAKCQDCVRMICRDRECQSVPLRYVCPPCGCTELHSAEHYFKSLANENAQQFANRVTPTEQPLQIVGRDAIYESALDALELSGVLSDVNQTERMFAIVDLQQLADQNPGRFDVGQLLKKVKSGTSWNILDQYDSRAGIHTENVLGWEPENINQRNRQALGFAVSSPYVLSGDKRISLMLNNPKPIEIEVVLRRPRISFLPTTTTNIVLETKSKSRVIAIDQPDIRTVARVKMGVGPQTLQIATANPLANHFVHVDVNLVLSDGSVVPIEADTVRLKNRVRTYQVTTKQEPLTFRVAGPTMIRVDHNNGGVTSQQTFAIATDRVVTIRPLPSQQSSLVRVFELGVDSPASASYRPSPAPPAFYDRWSDGVVQAMYETVDSGQRSVTLSNLSDRSPDLPSPPIVLDDYKALGLQEFGTWSLASGYRQRDAIEESDLDSVTERLFEFRLSRHLYHQWKDLYTQNDILFRPRVEGGPTLGFMHHGEMERLLNRCETDSCSESWGPYRFRWRAFAFTQFTDTVLSPAVSSTPWSAGVSGNASRTHRYSQTLKHTPNLNFFARTLSEDIDGYPPGEVDQDVFTQYKSDHRYGLRISDRFVYQPCLDRRWWINPSLMTNPDELTPDNVGVQFGTDQLLGPLQLKLAYRLTNFLADNDRVESSTQNVMSLDMVWEQWHSNTRRSEVSLSLRNDLSSGRSSIGFNFETFLNHVRRYRDIRPSTIPYPSIREERAAKSSFYPNR